MIVKKELEEKLQDISTSLENYNITVEDAYNELYNACMDYDYSLEDIFQDYIDYETANEIAKHELEEGGLYRLYYFMGEVNFGTAEILKINGYGNLEEVHYDNIRLIISEIEDRI